MKTVAQQMGQEAEDYAIRFLRKKGFTIKARNYRYQQAEIDIIAKKRRLLVFIEVKARSNDRFGDPETFVSARQKALIRAAAMRFGLISLRYLSNPTVSFSRPILKMLFNNPLI